MGIYSDHYSTLILARARFSLTLARTVWSSNGLEDNFEKSVELEGLLPLSKFLA